MQSSNAFRRVVPGSPIFFAVMIAVLLLLALLFAIYMQFVTHALSRLGMPPRVVSLAVVGIMVGALANIPIHRTRYRQVQLAQWATFYERWEEPFPIGMLRGNSIAINFGGALVPLLIAFWLVLRLSAEPFVLAGLVFASLLNVIICYRLGRIVPNIGIMLPGWIAPVVGIAMAWMLLPAGSPHHASFAFVTAVMGPFIGADLLNLKDIHRLGVGTMSIGGGGPFDGILLAGIIAAWLA